MYGIFTYNWIIFMVNVGKYIMHSVLGYRSWENTSVNFYVSRTFNHQITSARKSPLLLAAQKELTYLF